MKIALTTDSFVVTPYFYPGGDIGRLCICGTVNDLLMSGAVQMFCDRVFAGEEQERKLRRAGVRRAS